MRIGLLLGFATGFVALSYEIVWFRVLSFASQGRADAFAWLLGAYLAGVAFGSLAARRLCRGNAAESAGRAARALSYLLAAGALAFFVAPLSARMIVFWGTWWSALPLVGAAALLLGAAFPLVAHVAIPADARAGARLSFIYLANIVGSTAGSLATGLYLLDGFTLAEVSLGLALASLLAGLAFATYLNGRARARATAALLVPFVGAAAALTAVAAPLHEGLWERLFHKDVYLAGYRFPHVVENRSGVVTVDEQQQIHGHGVYDGAFNVRLTRDINGIVRAYALAGLHPRPRRVLMIGLSSGSWATVVANHPDVEELVVVEINPGYLQLLARFDSVRELLVHPKVRFVIDDGRRWLVKHPRERFDAIIANATFHWRANGTNLLSKEFLSMARAHLLPGGLYYFNTTNAPRVQKTVAEAFPHVIRLMNFFAGSDVPLSFDEERFRAALRRWRLAGTPVFDPARRPGDVAIIDRAVTAFRPYLEHDAAIRARIGRFAPIRDDNMGTEWEDRSRHPSSSPFAEQVK